MATILIKKIINLSPGLWDRINDYRFERRFDTETATFRDLLEKGLTAAAAEKNDGGERPEA